MEGDHVAVDKRGRLVDVKETSAPATLFVVNVTDALKEVDNGTIVRSVDREAVWQVESIVLSREVVEAMPDDPMTLEQLVEFVGSTGVGWEISPVSDL